MKLVCLVSLCDFISSSFFALGFPRGELCSVQGGVIGFFFVAGWLFLCYLSCNLYLLVIRKDQISFLRINLSVWDCCLVKTALPFSTSNSYGLDNLIEGGSPCGIAFNGHQVTGELWIAVTYFLPLLL